MALSGFCNACKLPFFSHIASFTYLILITMIQATQGISLSSLVLHLFAQSPTSNSLIRIGVNTLFPSLDSFTPLNLLPGVTLPEAELRVSSRFALCAQHLSCLRHRSSGTACRHTSVSLLSSHCFSDSRTFFRMLFRSCVIELCSFTSR